ncbi:MAG TPA: hypothetical protein VMS18_00065, partial [Candidatus Binatia bacterium]|nr:hypothetical protein [Candidatus Binatia bacterium]
FDHSISDCQRCDLTDNASPTTPMTTTEIRPTPPQTDVLQVLNEVYQLLDDYAPAWYSEELHAKLTHTLQVERATSAI